MKSTYGGNLFTADDVLYLKKYIDYCQDQGLVLRLVARKLSNRVVLIHPIDSLREICERIAIKVRYIMHYSTPLTVLTLLKGTSSHVCSLSPFYVRNSIPNLLIDSIRGVDIAINTKFDLVGML